MTEDTKREAAQALDGMEADAERAALVAETEKRAQETSARLDSALAGFQVRKNASDQVVGALLAQLAAAVKQRHELAQQADQVWELARTVGALKFRAAHPDLPIDYLARGEVQAGAEQALLDRGVPGAALLALREPADAVGAVLARAVADLTGDAVQAAVRTVGEGLVRIVTGADHAEHWG